LCTIEGSISESILFRSMSYNRPSNRKPGSIRPLAAELSPLHRSDGSASLRCGNTHILAAVQGPIAPRIPNRERYDRGVVSVAFSKGLVMMSNAAASGGGNSSTVQNESSGDVSNNSMTSLPVPLPSGGGATERELEYFVRDALSSCIMLERYPRCVIQVVIQIVQSDGSVLGTAVNCAVMALMDAGIAMRGLAVAATCVTINNSLSRLGEEDMDVDTFQEQNKNEKVTIWLDPTAEEESGEGHGVVVIVLDASKISNKTNSGSIASISKDMDQVKLNTEEEDNQKIITSFTYGSPTTLDGLLTSIERSKQSCAAFTAFMRLAVEQKVQKEEQNLWS